MHGQGMILGGVSTVGGDYLAGFLLPEHIAAPHFCPENASQPQLKRAAFRNHLKTNHLIYFVCQPRIDFVV